MPSLSAPCHIEGIDSLGFDPPVLSGLATWDGEVVAPHLRTADGSLLAFTPNVYGSNASTPLETAPFSLSAPRFSDGSAIYWLNTAVDLTYLNAMYPGICTDTTAAFVEIEVSGLPVGFQAWAGTHQLGILWGGHISRAVVAYDAHWAIIPFLDDDDCLRWQLRGFGYPPDPDDPDALDWFNGVAWFGHPHTDPMIESVWTPWWDDPEDLVWIEHSGSVRVRWAGTNWP